MPKDRAAQIQEIAEAVASLEESPLYEYRQRNGYHAVVGEGSLNAGIMFIGEAPGENEAKTGRPFVGAAGRILDDLLASIGLRREDVYITNIVKDRPPENRDPTVAEIALYSPFLSQQLEIIQPRVVVTLGRFAMTYILKRYNLPEAKQTIGKLHGKVLEAKAPYGEVSIVPLYHPASVFYNESQKAALKEDILALKPFVR
jgi:DNA polymerase